MQHLTALNHDSTNIKELSLRKRFFSYDQNEFPSLDDMEADMMKTTGSTNGKNHSGVKSKTNSMIFSTIDSATEQRLFENPKIIEETE
jgi:hypothetical protein